MKNIPKALIYEIADNQPIYYRGYKKCISGEKPLEALIGSTTLQSSIITKLVYLLMSDLDEMHTILTNEIGLRLNDKCHRIADIAIIETDKLLLVENKNQYLKIPPKIVIEIDTKADLGEVQNATGYYHRKTDELLDFGVEKVIWIFTDSRKVMIAEQNKDWQILSWSKDIHVLENVVVNLSGMVL